MRSFIAVIGKHSYCGGWRDCLEWSRAKIRDDHHAVARIFAARAGERSARVVAEVEHGSERTIRNGRLVPVQKLLPCRE